MKANEIATAIIDGNFGIAEINIIINAVKEAQRLSRAKASAMAVTSMKVGATGVLTGLRPKHINGTKVKVLEVKRSRVSVQEVGNNSFSGRYTVPAQCIILD